MKSFFEVKAWADRHPLIPVHVDCATAVMLKILDGKCKMNAGEKAVMTHLYRAVKHRPGRILGKELYTLIESATVHRDAAMIEAIYEKRLLAETMISRPVMKSFKSMIRQQGLFDIAAENTDSPEKVIDNPVDE